MADNSAIMEDRVVVTVGGMEITGWKNFSVKRAMEGLAASFSVGIVNPTSWEASKILAVGEACTIAVENSLGERTTLVTGYIDKRTRKRTGTGTEFQVNGRDKTGDLVDCAAIRSSGTWTSADLRQICRDLCKPYGIEVIAQNYNGEKFQKFTLQSGESAFQAIERACRMRATTPLTDPQGRLVLSRAIDQTHAVQTLVDNPETGNLLEISEDEDSAERFQEYVVKGQGQGDGGSWDDSSTAPTGKAKDPNVGRFRQVIIMAEGKATSTTCKLRATWEAQVRAGRAKTYTATVRGWFQNGTGPIWDINQQVDIVSSAWELNSRLLVTGVEYTLDENGRKTVLELKHPDTYKPDPTEPTKEESK